MNRHLFFLGIGVSLLSPTVAFAAMQKFVFKIRTKNGSIISNIVIEAKDQFAAISILRKRYPDCEILEAKQK